jgi:hypothetical protein
MINILTMGTTKDPLSYGLSDKGADVLLGQILVAGYVENGKEIGVLVSIIILRT